MSGLYSNLCTAMACVVHVVISFSCLCKFIKKLATLWVRLVSDLVLHGPSMFASKAKIYGVLYNQASSIAYDETSSYWSVLKRS